MKQYFLLLLLSVFTLLFISGCQGKKDTAIIHTEIKVEVAGAMKNVMRFGNLESTIFLDTIQQKKHLYGIGPLEFLQGEVLINNGESFVSKVETDSTMIVEKTFDVKAPFFVYATVSDWDKEMLPDNISNLETLETYLDEKFKDRDEPFVFKISGRINAAKIHIVNLPEDTKISSPDDAHQGITYYPLQQEEVEIIGFFSREHQSIFTHHDTFIHLHLITQDKQKMGHLDELDFGSNQLTLYWSK